MSNNQKQTGGYPMTRKTTEQIRNSVRYRYAKTAKGETSGCGCTEKASCCTDGSSIGDQLPIALGYSQDQLQSVPDGANMGLGCGNPQAIAMLKAGEVVVDLGSGGGFDCFLAAKAVGPSGTVIGVDMTPEMIDKARINVEKGGYTNVEFRLGEIEHLPVADQEADVIISNCVINLSPEKEKAYQEAYRVLRPGGRLAVSDILALREIPDEYREDLDLLGACISGAETVDATRKILEDLGFDQIKISVNKKSKDFLKDFFPGNDLGSYISSASIQAVKPMRETL
jgi:arsenite methyltransferase